MPLSQEEINQIENERTRLRTYFAAMKLLRGQQNLGQWFKTVCKLSLVILFLAFPPVYMGFRPQDYSPFVQVLLSIFLFLLAYWIGNTAEAEKATQRANDRWLPQAESVILRLLTLRANVRRFSRTTKNSCGTTSCDLPELQTEPLRAVRLKMKTDCDASGQRLDDVAHQLEDAIEDWRRFVAANCQGAECQRIFEAIQQREESLQRELDGDGKTAVPAPSAS
jgi:hypothetical protein